MFGFYSSVDPQQDLSKELAGTKEKPADQPATETKTSAAGN